MNHEMRLRLPATSANLGPAFDTAAIALDLHLEIVARRARAFGITARGRDAEPCGKLEGNLILSTYRELLAENGCAILPLQMDVANQIPLGMGCGSSAAARLAGIALAVELGELAWSDDEILAYATALEGHPDNVTACWLGGMTVSAINHELCGLMPLSRSAAVRVARLNVPPDWAAAVVFPRHPVLTRESRKVLPQEYGRADVVRNLQACSLLVAAFAAGNGDLLRTAMRDCLHQPYRSKICPLLHRVEDIYRVPGVLGVSLSGAGPGLLLILSRARLDEGLERELRLALGGQELEWIFCGFNGAGRQRMPAAAYELGCPAAQ